MLHNVVEGLLPVAVSQCPSCLEEFELAFVIHYTFVNSLPRVLFVDKVHDFITLCSPRSTEPQNLSVQLSLRPTSAIGVLFVLVHQDRVPLSIALADYHPGTDEWRDVSFSIKTCVCVYVNFLFTVCLI